MKKCSQCQTNKPLDEFIKNRSRKDGYASVCKLCKRTENHKYNKGKRTGRVNTKKAFSYVNKEDYRLQYTYGITLQDKLDMLERQNYQCFICYTDLRDLPDKNVHVDHCHTTGKVRSMLCYRCNNGLGMFKENPDILRRAALYTEYHRDD